MKHKFIFLAVLLTVLAIPYNALAEYDFSAVTPTGQTLYYTIINSNENQIFLIILMIKCKIYFVYNVLIFLCN